MKKVVWLLCATVFAWSLNSCTPSNYTDEVLPQACCGDEGDLPPYTPPPGDDG